MFARHGVYAGEKERGQLFKIDLDIQADLAEAGRSDRLSHTINYAGLIERVQETVHSERHNLIERVAQRVADVVLEDRMANEVTVSVHKADAPVAADFEDIAVTITRGR